MARAPRSAPMTIFWPTRLRPGRIERDRSQGIVGVGAALRPAPTPTSCRDTQTLLCGDPQQLAIRAPVHLGEVQLIHCSRDDVKFTWQCGAYGVAIQVRSTRKIIGEQRHLFVTQLAAAIPVPPAPVDIYR